MRRILSVETFGNLVCGPVGRRPAELAPPIPFTV